jgi:hypothetical protein
MRPAESGVAGRDAGASKRADLWSHGWTTRTVPTLPRTEQAEPASMLGECGVQLDEDERRPPTAPRLRQAGPENPIRHGQTKSRGARAIQDRPLMPEREDLEMQSGARSTC